MKPKVAIINSTYERIDIKELLTSIDYTPKKKKILLKPNIVGPKDENSHVITNPKVLIALIEYFKDYEIVIGEGSVAGTDTKLCFKSAGYEEIAKKYNVKLLDFNVCERKKVKWKYGELSLPKILDTHEYINVAKMKTHLQTTVTLAMKNQKGLLSPLDKKEFHKSGEINAKIAALNEVIKPDLNVIDAIDCMEGNGPGAEGTKITINKLLASTDVYAIDNAALKIMGIPINKVKYMKKQEYETIGILSEHRFKMPDEYYHKLGLRMWFNSSCSGCNHNIMTAIKTLPKYPFKTIKFLFLVTFGKLNIIAGPDYSKLPKKGKIICVGTCTKKLAKEKGYFHIDGCPPKVEEIIKWL
ncbi:DUF362 domain-containing protein [archaeon]|jgi:uncharacterized protein (DUF362 family)|nr:DUF362 domain-containing protein [archaeon]MBT4416968.1 DUF362 domain-containing protein [archaeon]